MCQAAKTSAKPGPLQQRWGLLRAALQAARLPTHAQTQSASHWQVAHCPSRDQTRPAAARLPSHTPGVTHRAGPAWDALAAWHIFQGLEIEPTTLPFGHWAARIPQNREITLRRRLRRCQDGDQAHSVTPLTTERPCLRAPCHARHAPARPALASPRQS